jgi:hypothetical protein
MWKSEPEEDRAAYARIFESSPQARIAILQNEMPWLMKANLVIGSAGVLYSLVVIAFFSENPQACLSVVISLILVFSQIAIFVRTTLRALDYLRSWIKEFPSEARER